jgi:hypothetical protein
MAGFLMGRFLPRQIADAMVEIRISNATVTGTPSGNLEVAILPATLPEGLEIELLCEDKLLNKTETVTCVSDGNYYRATLSRPEKFRWCVTAVLIYKGNKTQIPLWEIDGDETITLTAKWSVKVTFKQSDCEDITRYYFVGTSVTKEEMPVVTPKDGYLVKWEVTAEEKLTNLQGDVVIEAIEQSLTWSPVA